MDRMRLYKWLDLRALRRFDRVILVHDGMKAIPGIDRIDERRLRVIENGLANSSPGETAALDSRVLAFCQGSVVVGAIGRLSPEKGFDRLIDAFARLLRFGVDAKLVVLGEGPERAALERTIVEKGLTGRVLMPGFVDGARHLPLFSTFVLSSSAEGLPISLLEAMRARVPIVATRVGGVPSVLGEAYGLLVEPNDVEALTTAIRRAVTDKSLASRLVNAAESRVRAFTSVRMAARYLDEYSELVSHNASVVHEPTQGLPSRR